MFEIANNGVDLSKLVIGKPATASDATNGHMNALDVGHLLGNG